MQTGKIEECIKFLEENGYKVINENSHLIGKWVAFHQPGMEPILHGQIIKDFGLYFHVKCKNRRNRYPKKEEVINIFDNKDECYLVR